MKTGSLAQLNTAEMIELFSHPEGVNSVYFGQIGNGKTRSAVADAIELLKQGEVVYANFKIKLEDYDERDSKIILWVKLLFARKYFFKYKLAENFHYIDRDDLISATGEMNIEFLSRLVGAHIFLDEGQWLFNSMERLNMNDADSVAKHKLILHGRHYCRSLNIITQRPENIFKTMRSQVNIWQRCVKRFDMFGLMIFQRWSIQDMKDDLPVCFEKDSETGRETPLGDCKTYWVNKKHDPVFASYDTHGMRQEDAIEVSAQAEVYSTTFPQRLGMVVASLLPAWALKAQAVQSAPVQPKLLRVTVDEEVRSPEIRRG